MYIAESINRLNEHNFQIALYTNMIYLPVRNTYHIVDTCDAYFMSKPSVDNLLHNANGITVILTQ